MSLQPYYLDRIAHDLVLKYCKEDAKNQAHKMRSMVAYGLERFWGEQIRLQGSQEGNYWRDTWNELAKILSKAGISLPNDPVNKNNTQHIKNMADQLWDFNQQHRKVALAVLTQLCDSLVWWTQRYK
jgi:sugar phosphate isomerase/epimerase